MFAGELSKILTADPHGALIFVKDSHLNLLYEYVEHNRGNNIEARHWKVSGYDIVKSITRKSIKSRDVAGSPILQYQTSKHHRHRRRQQRYRHELKLLITAWPWAMPVRW